MAGARIGRVATAAAVPLACAALAGSAGAASVGLVHQGSNKGPAPPPFASFGAAPGEPNDVVVTMAGSDITFTDAIVPVTARDGCIQVDPHRVTCRNVAGAWVFTGDLDDRVRAPTAMVTGGTGDDTIESGGSLNGGDGDDVLRGGPGSDGIIAGRGADRVHAGGGGDQIADVEFVRGAEPPQPEHDLFDGGPGPDRVNYRLRGDPGVLDLSRDLGPAPDHDTLVSVEGGVSGLDGEVLLGDDGANDLEAWGRSFLAGGAGNDRLRVFGLRVEDRLDGGSGDDVLTLNHFQDDLATRDRLRCGTGSDTVWDVAPNQLVPADCEGIAFVDGPVIRLPRRRARSTDPLASVRGHCEDGPCTVTGVLRIATSAEPDEKPRSGASLARGSARGSDLRRAHVILRLTERGRRLVRRGTCTLATIYVTGVGLDPEHLALLRFGRRCAAEPPLEP